MNNLSTETKQEITARAKQYLVQNNLTATDLSKTSRVNQSYLSNILNGVYSYDAGGKSADINDKYMVRVAESVGMQVKKQHWKFVETREFKEIVSQLMDARERGVAKALICNTGRGKTYNVKRFREKLPAHTYVITINDQMKLPDIIRELMYLLNVDSNRSQAERIRELIMKIRDLRRAGHKPTIVLDECENMNLPTMRMIKGLYDGICEDRYASVVLMGTTQLLQKIERNKESNREAGPQFYRRFKAGIRMVPELPVAQAFIPFFEAHGIEDKQFRALLCSIADNYGELHDYLEPALREADEQDKPLTEELFRIIHNMPK